MRKQSRYILSVLAVLLLIAACDNRAAENASLTEELNSLQAQVGDFESQVEAQTEELQSARQRVAELEAQLAEQQQQLEQVEALEGERDQLRTQVDEVRQQLAARNTALQQAQARVRALEQRRETTLESQLEEVNQQIERLTLERTRLTQRLEAEAAGEVPAGDSAGNAADDEAVIGPADAESQPQGTPETQQGDGE